MKRWPLLLLLSACVAPAADSNNVILRAMRAELDLFERG